MTRFDVSQQGDYRKLTEALRRVGADAHEVREFRLSFDESRMGEASGGWYIPVASDDATANAYDLMQALEAVQRRLEQQTDLPVNVVLDVGID